MDRTPLVSVVIASYNMAQYLPLAVDSVLRQTVDDLEVHVVDDGSTDGTERVMAPMLSDPRVCFVRQDNQGQARAKNRGLRDARGKFIAFLDADDLWTPNKLEVQLPCFDLSSGIGVVHTNFAHMDGDGRVLSTPKRDYYDGWISDKLLIENFVNGMASVVRRECFDTMGLFDESLPMGIDYDLWLRFSARYQFHFLDEVTYLYRQWPGQMSHRVEERFECAIRIMQRFLERNPGLVEPSAVAEAWAHTFVSRGNWKTRSPGRRWAAFRDYALALRHKPTYMHAWYAIAKLLVL